ncbi:hypothetical protein BJ122_10592 [Rhodopseudomonas faecalis]|uniref:Uncharacterized protein n=1 Tax=Rhodopseudomonas faecalis TaxID=99655 RepID=A0A318TPJ7_9BRAD|nr:hypothetical protein [Rhodopseudomonas faecalis]PYF03835.1 hypothetical protein BJ122_10592 [Rhodopseudomonas faecalis]
MSTATNTTPRRDVDLSAAVAAYSGRTLLGWLKHKSERCEAITPDGRSLGLYNNVRAAWGALAELHHQGAPA